MYVCIYMYYPQQFFLRCRGAEPWGGTRNPPGASRAVYGKLAT